MTRMFTAHLKTGADPAAAVLIEDRWRWGGFAFPLLWALWSRHWLAALALLLAMAGVALLGAGGHVAAAAAAELGLRFAVGFEGAPLARLDRRLRGWREVGAVDAVDAEEAEAIWFGARAA